VETSIENPRGLEGRFLGAFLGCAIGDALGMPLEGRPIPPDLTSESLLRQYRPLEGWPPGQYTDDTMLTLALARSIMKHRCVAGGHVIAEFAELWRSGTIVGAGRATNDAVGNYLYKHKPWDECGAPVGNAGNGAAMRAAPVGLWYSDDHDALVPAAVEAAEVTHRDPRSVSAAVAVALMTAHAVGSEELEPVVVLNEIALRVLEIDTGVSDHLLRLADWLADSEEDVAERIVATGQFGPWRGTWSGRITAYAIPTLLISFYSFLRHQDDFGAAVAGAILAGGDVDTTGAIAGALSGTLLGADAIPDRLRSGVLNAKDISHFASEFHAARFGIQ